MKNILIVSGSDLNDEINGSTTVLRNYLKYVPENYKITVFNNTLRKTKKLKNNFDKNIEIIDFEKEVLDYKKNFKFFPFLSYSYLVLARNKKILEELGKADVLKKYDLVYFHGVTSYTECYLNNLKGKRIINLIDLYSYAYKKYFLSEESILKKLFCLKEYFFAKLIEKKIIKRFEKLILVNTIEKEYANNYYKTNSFYSVPIGIEFTEKKNKNEVLSLKNNINLVFIGNMSFKPNLDGILCFYNDYFLNLEEKYKLHIIGPGSKELAIDDKRVIKYGFVDNLDTLLEKMDFGIATMKNGGGQKNKILDYLSRGIPTFVNDYTYVNNKFESEFIYLANTSKELEVLIDEIYEKKYSKLEIVKSVEKYSAKKSAEKFWGLLEESMKKK